MRKIMCLVLLITLLVIGGCKEDKWWLPDGFWEDVEVLYNEALWEAYVKGLEHSSQDGMFDLIINHYNEQGFLRGGIAIIKIPKVIGYYPLSETTYHEIDSLVGASYHTSVADGDVAGNSYDLFEDNTPNFIEITEFDEVSREVKGRFNANFLIDLDFGKEDFSAPDTVRFSQGVFHTRIE